MSELLPCPFCGGEAEVQHQTRELYGDVVDWYGVYCKKQFCGYVSGQSTEAEAVAAWNTRAERTCQADYRSGGYGIGGWYCSECGGYMHDDMQQDMAYCPNCGAKVIGG